MKKICIVGSSGYIGSYLASELKENYRVISHSRKKIKDTDFNRKIIKHIIGDITKNSTIKKILKSNPEVIIYTISLNHFDSEVSLSNSLKINYEPFHNLVEQILESKKKVKLIYFSTMQVYGREYKKKIISENYPKNITNIYSLTHSMCEDLLQAYESKIVSHSVRLSNSYGMPKLKNLNCWWPVLNDLCRSAKKKNLIRINSDGSALRDFISLDDVTKFIKILIQKKVKEKIINLCSSETISIKDLAYIIQKNKFFKKKVVVSFAKKPKKTKKKIFFYDNKIMRKYNFKTNDSLQNQIKNFLKKI